MVISHKTWRYVSYDTIIQIRFQLVPQIFGNILDEFADELISRLMKKTKKKNKFKLTILSGSFLGCIFRLINKISIESKSNLNISQSEITINKQIHLEFHWMFHKCRTFCHDTILQPVFSQFRQKKKHKCNQIQQNSVKC